MKAGIITFTKQGYETGKMVRDFLISQNIKAELRVKSRYAAMEAPLEALPGSISEWIPEYWQPNALIVIIGASGIAVRLIAPFIKDKLQDPAVLVIDAEGSFCISLLSGHLGGANRWTSDISRAIGSQPVITTATDKARCFAIDLYGQEAGLTLSDKKLAKSISAALLARVKCVTIGIGCRRNASVSQITSAVDSILCTSGIPPECILKIASIDLKKNEPGLLAFCKEHSLPFVTFSSEKLANIKGDYSHSLFVEKQTGVGNVCERSAVCACDKGILICRKTVYSSVTAAAAIDIRIL